MRGIVDWVICSGPLAALCFLFGTLLVVPPASYARETRVGATALGGLGLFAPAEDAIYNGVDLDAYPEVGLQIDVSALRFGVRAGWIYNKMAYYQEGWDGYYYYYDTAEYTRSYIPIQAEVLIAPLDLFMENAWISPYAGVMGGAFVAIGDNDDTTPAFTIKMGSEIRLDILVLYGDIRYTWATADVEYWTVTGPWKDNVRVDANIGGFMMVAGLGLRWGFTR